MTKKKKLFIISTIVILSFVVIGIVYAFFTDYNEVKNRFRLGSLNIEDYDLSLKKGEVAKTTIEPGDIDILSWTTKNEGTMGAKTRQTLEIYFKDDASAELVDLLHIYPANMTDSAILEDFEKGLNSEYEITAEKVTKAWGNKTIHGLKYQFVSDTLNGTDNKNINQEVNYNLDNSEVTIADFTTDDTSATQDNIAFKVLLSPQTSYLYQGSQVYIRVTTEGMQYTEDGSGTWQIVETAEIGE